MANLTELNPSLAATLGYDMEAALDKDVVTLVRRKVVLEEVVISRGEFDKINASLDDEETPIYWSELNWKDAGWDDYTAEETLYTAFPGNVTSFSDDCVMMLDCDWNSSYCALPLNEMELRP